MEETVKWKEGRVVNTMGDPHRNCPYKAFSKAEAAREQ